MKHPFGDSAPAYREAGLPVIPLRRAVNAGLLPYHTPFSSRRRVLLSEVRAAMASFQKGASHG